MAIDFRDVYASLLKDWFEVDPNIIQGLFEQNISYIDLLQGCTNASAEQVAIAQQKALVFPNPSLSKHQLKFNSRGEQYEIFLVNQQGKVMAKVFEGFIQAGEFTRSFEVTFLPQGSYYYLLKSTAHQELVNFQKI
jgi:hypothetical protein